MATRYCIVRMNPGLDRSVFASARAQGAHETSFDTIRTSLDGKEGILKWDTAIPRPAALAGHVVAEYSWAEMRAFLETNATAWEQSPLAEPTSNLLAWAAGAAAAGTSLLSMLS